MEKMSGPTDADDNDRGDEAAPAVARDVCPSCGSTDFASLEVPERGVTVNVCRECNLHINAAAAPVEQQAAEQIYEDAYQTPYERDAARKLESSAFRLRLIEVLQQPGSFLDVGCSVGSFLQAAADRGWDAWGVDISQYAVAACQQHGLQAKIGDMQHLDFPDQAFDVINLRHVLEHDWDLYACLAEIRRVLKPGGQLVLEVPHVDFRRVRTHPERYLKFWEPCHCYWFSDKSVRNILLRAGFREVRMPCYGKLALSGGAVSSLRFLAWRSFVLLGWLLGINNYHVSVWERVAAAD